MKSLKTLFIILLIFNIQGIKVFAQTPHYIDFQLILNQSIAGKKAQNELKNKLNSTVEKLNVSQKIFKKKKKK